MFRGVKMADTRSVTAGLVDEFELAGAPVATLFAVARECFTSEYSEDKLGGILLLAEHALHDTRLDHVDALAGPLASGDLADWNTVDWYCVKVLGPFISGPDVVERARAIAAWRDADVLWQRRAAAVAFVSHAARDAELFEGFHALILEVAHSNASDDARWSQTSVGWLLRELSRHHRSQVERFLDDHPHLSPEATRNARKYLSDPGSASS